MPRKLLSHYVFLLLGITSVLAAARASEEVNKNRTDDSALHAKHAAIFAKKNLVAWCIVPFDANKRGPEDRAAMLNQLGIRKLAYDYRAEHVPTFNAEMEALKKHHIELTAWWFPTTLNDEARLILDVLKRHGLKTQLWVTGGGGPKTTDEERAWITAEAQRIRLIAEAAAEIGCKVGLYNHGGWFGEPENQIAIIKELNLPNVGIVYNLHHGHAHVDRFPDLLKKMQPHIYAVNLNGMNREGDQKGEKILPLGMGELDLSLLRSIRDSGYRGPIGILNHTDLDAEARLRDNLDGLEWLIPQLDGQAPGIKPNYRTWPPIGGNGAIRPFNPRFVAESVAGAKQNGIAERGIAVFTDAKFACISCHKIGKQGGSVGPELTSIGKQRTDEQIVESIFWPKREVKPEFKSITVLTTNGQQHRGYEIASDGNSLTLREPTRGTTIVINRDEIEEEAATGTLMPDGLSQAMSRQQQLDLFRFLTGLGRNDGLSIEIVDTIMDHANGHAPADFPYEREPLHPERWPHRGHPVNRGRLYDYYTKEAEHFRGMGHKPTLLPEFPGLDSGKEGHWGNQNEKVWADDRWNKTDLGSLQSGIFHAKLDQEITVPRGVCVRLGENSELSACFNPDTLRFEVVWSGGFVKFSSVRHGFMDGLTMEGTPVNSAEARQSKLQQGESFEYRGFYRHGGRVLFCYCVGETEYLDVPWAENGRFSRIVAPRNEHPLKHLAEGGPARWPQVLETKIVPGTGTPYAIDTIELPIDNPWNALIFCGDHDFLPDGSAVVCTMQGDVWRVAGLSDSKHRTPIIEGVARWRRFATGLNQALGLVVADDAVYVLGRDQITRLRDLNGDGEADLYQCFSNAYVTSSAGHDFICGLQHDDAGNFYIASGNQGLIRISPDGRRADVIATGFRNPDGVGIYPDGTLTLPCSEGEWTPASMICAVRPMESGEQVQNAVANAAPFGGSLPANGERSATPPATIPSYGYRGPVNGRPPELPFVYLPRGLDNSSAAQTYVNSDRWGPLEGRLIHFSYGTGTHFLVLRDEVDGQLQGAAVPLAGEFLSGAHRGRFHPVDGQLYVSGMAGWGTYTIDDGCFQRVRYTGDPVQLPSAFHVHQNGVSVTFTRPIDPSVAAKPESHFAQCWNYRYSEAYGSPEFSTQHPGTRGHDVLVINSAQVLPDGHTLFVELPELQPVNQLHLRLHVDSGEGHDLFVTVHKLDAPFENFPGYRPVAKKIAPHPILSDLALATKRVPNPWRKSIPEARPLNLETAQNLSFATRALNVKAGEAIKFTLVNPDVVPHNWALVKPGALQRVGEMANRLIADPEAAVRQYIPQTDDVLFYTDVVPPREKFTIHFRAPMQPGRYPYLCTFPGHWMVMNGELIVK